MFERYTEKLLSTPTLTPERSRRHLFDMPTMQPQHAMTTAGKSEIMRGYQEIFVTRAFNHSHLNLALNQHLGVRIPRGQPIPSCGSPS